MTATDVAWAVAGLALGVWVSRLLKRRRLRAGASLGLTAGPPEPKP